MTFGRITVLILAKLIGVVIIGMGIIMAISEKAFIATMNF